LYPFPWDAPNAQGKLRGFTVANGNGGNHSDTMTTSMNPNPNMTVTETTTMEDDDDDTSTTDDSGGPSPPPPPPPPSSTTTPARGLRGKIGVLNDFIFLSEITILTILWVFLPHAIFHYEVGWVG